MNTIRTHLPQFALALCLLSTGLFSLVSPATPSAHAAGLHLSTATHYSVQAAPTTPRQLGTKIFKWVLQLVTPIQIAAFGIGIIMIAVYGLMYAVGDHAAMSKLWRVAFAFILIGAAVTIGRMFAGLMGINLP